MQFLDINSRLSLAVAQDEYDQAIKKLLVRLSLSSLLEFAPGDSFAITAPTRDRADVCCRAALERSLQFGLTRQNDRGATEIGEDALETW